MIFSKRLIKQFVVFTPEFQFLREQSLQMTFIMIPTEYKSHQLTHNLKDVFLSVIIYMKGSVNTEITTFCSHTDSMFENYEDPDQRATRRFLIQVFIICTFPILINLHSCLYSYLRSRNLIIL